LATLLQQGAYRILTGFPAPERLAALRADALEQLPRATDSCVERSDGEEGRGGNPPRRFLSAAGGPAQQEFYRSGELARRLAGEAGAAVRPTGAGATYTYYCRAGDYIGIHLDIRTCDLVAITCLSDNAPAAAGNAGKLCFWPGAIGLPLSGVRARPAEGAVVRRLAPGETLVMLGGLLPHALLPVRAGQVRIISVMCFEVIAG
jgi:hypothetical protein